MICKIILILVSSFVVNIFWAYYIKFTSENKMFKAAIFGELILVCGATITYNYVQNIYFIIPAIVGGFFGTLYSEKIKKFFGVKSEK